MRLAMSHTLLKMFSLSTLSTDLDSYSNRLKSLTNRLKSNTKGLASYLFTLEKDEVLRIPSTCQEIRVLSGVAWLTVAGEDVILNSGEKALVSCNEDFVLLSALGKVPLILEVL
jgi:hypothetical protein